MSWQEFDHGRTPRLPLIRDHAPLSDVYQATGRVGADYRGLRYANGARKGCANLKQPVADTVTHLHLRRVQWMIAQNVACLQGARLPIVCTSGILAGRNRPRLTVCSTKDR